MLAPYRLESRKTREQKFILCGFSAKGDARVFERLVKCRFHLAAGDGVKTGPLHTLRLIAAPQPRGGYATLGRHRSASRACARSPLPELQNLPKRVRNIQHRARRAAAQETLRARGDSWCSSRPCAGDAAFAPAMLDANVEAGRIVLTPRKRRSFDPGGRDPDPSLPRHLP
jgi:hypothetical protein